MNTQHLTREEILLYVDGELPQERRARAKEHLGECPSCAATAAGMERIGRAVRRIPLERASAGFTASVLRELGLAPSPHGRSRVLEGAAALVAMVVVAGILLTVFFAAGVLKQTPITDTQSMAGTVLEKGGDAVAGALGAVSGWLDFHAAPASGILGISIAALVVMGLLAVVDAFAGRKLVRRVE